MQITERNYSRILGRKHITEIGTMKKLKKKQLPKDGFAKRKWNTYDNYF
jgi:hypothetical protein